MLTRGFKGIEGFFWIGIGASLSLLAWKARLGSFQEPGPGFIAFLSGLFISIIGLVMVLSQALSKISHGHGPNFLISFKSISWFRLGYTMTLLLGYALFLDILGYILTTFLTMWALFYNRGKYAWALSLVPALITVGVTYLVFEVWLRLLLPRGIFPWW